MAVKEINIRGHVQPEITMKGKITPSISFKGEIQKSSGSGAGVIMKTKAEWAALPTLMSHKGVLYVYTDYRQEEDPETHEIINIPRMKIGDGMSYVADLPFSTMSITDEDIARWNDHVSVIVDEETHNMIFYH